MWTDAAGAARGLAAVLYCAGKFYFTVAKTPQHVWDQFLERGYNQIGCQEMLAVGIGFYTFESLVRGTHCLAFVDHEGVRAALQHGGTRAPEVSMLVHHFWQAVAQSSVAWFTARVESKANVADGPSRDNFSEMIALEAICQPVRWPPWALQLW